jgi:hypothetical protein
MRDGKLQFGNIVTVTKDTLAVSADLLDFGALQTGYTKSTKHKTGETADLAVVFQITADAAAADSFACRILECATEGGSYTTVVEGATIAAPKAGILSTLPLPRTHLRFLKAAIYPTSSGTATEATIAAWIEPGSQAE